MSVLVDTNVLLRRTQPGHPSHFMAVESVAILIESGETVCFTLQNIAEFWNVATRSTENNGLGLSLRVTLAQVDSFERMLTLLQECPAINPEWKRLVVEHKVLGVKVHDSRLVAAMHVHGIRKILTFNTSDFTRFDVEAVHPATVLG